MKTSAKWEFYYENNNNQIIVFEEKTCVLPSKTKKWKKLKQLFNSNKEINAIGFRIKE